MIASITWFLFSTRLRIFLTCLAALIGLYALVGFIVVPWVARPKVVETIAELTGRETRLDTLKLNPFMLSGSIAGFEITDTDGESLLSVEKAYANIQVFSFLFGGTVHLKKVDLAKPYFRLKVNEDSTLNIADIINQVTAMMAEQEPAEETEPRILKLDLLRVADGAILFEDASRSAPFISTIAPISFDITGFHTGGANDAPYAFSATSESGEAFSWKGFVAFNPLRSNGSFSVTGFSMPKYEPFFDTILATDVVSGTIGVSGSYQYSSGADGLMLLEDAAITIEDVEVVKADTQDLIISLRHGSITGARVDALTRELEVEAVTLTEGSLRAKRLADGQIDLIALVDQSVFSPDAAVTQPGATENKIAEGDDTLPDTATPSPSYLIHSVVLEGFSIEVTDESLVNPASFALDNVTVRAGDIRSDEGAPLDLSMSAESRDGGSFSVEGSLSYQPIKGSLDLEVLDLVFISGNPYLSEFADVQITSGQVTATGRATVDMSGDTLAGGFDGRFSLGELDVVGGETGQPLLHLTRLDFDDITANLEPRSVVIGAITVVDPQATVLINEDGTINLLQALRMGDEESELDQDKMVDETAEEPTGFALGFPVTIGSITLENVRATVTDRSITPSVTLGLETLSGTISGLSSEELARADLDLTGTLIGDTELTITGQINPLIADRYSDVVMTFKNFNLTQISPYSGKYAGYALQGGKLSFDLKYSISQAELNGENKVVIDQLTLGDKVESEDALKLPIPLAVSLMKDRDGVIKIDVPVTGNLNDPEFGFGRVISQAIVNILSKIVTSPFSLLGNLVPGGADVDLSFVAFAPGSAALNEETIEKLTLMAEALEERPTLNLEIIGAAGGAAESNLLKTQLLDDNLKVIRWREIKDRGNKSFRLKEVVVTPEDHDRLIVHSFNLMFPNLAVDPKTAMAEAEESRAAAQAAQPPPTPVEDSAAPAKEDKEPGGLVGFFKRLFGGGSKAEADEPASLPPTSPATTTEPVAVAAQTEDAKTDSSSQPTVATALTVEQMASRLLETIEVPDEDLRGLADARAEAVRLHLETEGAIASARLFVTDPEDPSSISADGGEAQVRFNLE